MSAMDTSEVPYMTMLAVAWALCAGALLFAIPVAHWRIQEREARSFLSSSDRVNLTLTRRRLGTPRCHRQSKCRIGRRRFGEESDRGTGKAGRCIAFVGEGEEEGGMARVCAPEGLCSVGRQFRVVLV